MWSAGMLLVNRFGGLGDELCLTPAYRQLQKDEGGYTDIAVRGKFAADILKYNDDAWVPEDVESVISHGGYKIVDVKWHNEIGWGYDIPLVDFYAIQLGVKLEDKSLKLPLSDEDVAWSEWMEELPRPIVCYNTHGGWRTKALNVPGVAAMLASENMTLIQVGANNPFTGTGYNMVDQTPSIRHSGSMLRRADLYLGNDAGPYHVASAVGCRSVVLFGSTDPACYIHNPDRELAIYNPECYGCYNREADTSVITGGCPRGTYACMQLDVDRIISSVHDMLELGGSDDEGSNEGS